MTAALLFLALACKADLAVNVSKVAPAASVNSPQQAVAGGHSPGVGSQPEALATSTPMPAPKLKAESLAVGVDHLTLTAGHLSWSAATEVETNDSKVTYLVYLSTTSGDAVRALAASGQASQAVSTSSEQQFNLAGLKPALVYYVDVVAVSTSGARLSYNASSFTTVADTTPPIFPAALTATANAAGVALAWTAATDDQALWGEQAVTYQIFRKTGITFADAHTPLLDGALVASSSSTVYSDTTVVDGQIYYYVVAALDEAGNATNTPAVAATALDRTKPTISNLLLTAAATTNQWNVSWTGTDNLTLHSQLNYDVYVGANTVPLISGPGLGSIIVAGPTVETFLQYTIKVTDSAGNFQTAQFAIYPNSALFIGSVTRPSGLLAGGELLVFNGGSLDLVGSATVGGQPCTGADLWHKTMLGCTAPASASVASVAASVLTADGAVASLPDAYAYRTDLTSPCDQAQTTAFAAGDGSAGSPYVISTLVQLNGIRSLTGAPFLTLGNNLSFAGLPVDAMDPVDFSALTGGKFDGAGLVIGRWSSTKNGLFQAANQFSIENLSLPAISIHTTQAGAGGLVGTFTGQTTARLNSLFVSGVLVSTGTAAGLAYNVAAPAAMNRLTSDVVLTATGNAGLMFGTISAAVVTDATVSGSLTALSNSYAIGGLAGLATNLTVSYAAVTANIHAGYNAVGGVCGAMNGGSLTSVTYSGNLSESSTGAGKSSFVGGLIGQIVNASDLITISDSHTSGTYVGAVIVGGLIGDWGSTAAGGTVDQSSSAAVIQSSGNQAGGLIGSVEGSAITISNSFATGAVQPTIDAVGAGSFYGGLIGSVILSTVGSQFFLQNSYATGNVNQTFSAGSRSRVGGLIGNAGAMAAGALIQITNSYATGLAKADGDAVGGLIGNAATSDDNVTGALITLSQSYSSGSVVAGGNGTGGMIGDTSKNGAGYISINQCYTSSPVTGANNVGGFVGNQIGSYIAFADSYATGNISGLDYVGGIVGNNFVAAALNVYYTGHISYTGSHVGGLAGSVGYADISQDFWDTDLSGVATSSIGSGETTLQMADPATFTGFDLVHIWKTAASSGPPVLKWQP